MDDNRQSRAAWIRAIVIALWGVGIAAHAQDTTAPEKFPSFATIEALRNEQSAQTWYTVGETLVRQYPTVGALLVLVCLDVVSGLLVGGMKGELSSIVSFRGMCGKAMIFAIIATGRVIEFIIPGVPWSQLLAVGFCITEAISITENAAKAGLPIPQQWTEALEKLKQKKAAEKSNALSDLHTIAEEMKDASFRKPTKGKE